MYHAWQYTELLVWRAKRVEWMPLTSGQSRRPIRVRFNEHLGDAHLRKPDTGLGDHTFGHHADMDNKQVNVNFHIEIITTKDHEADLRTCESIFIREHNPSVNTKSRSWCLTKHVIYEYCMG